MDGTFMISILNRYIAKSVMIATLLVVVVVVGLTFFISLLGELKDIGVGDYGFMQAVEHVMLGLPYNVYQLFPMLALVGSVMGLGILSSNRELIVMRASGVSLRQIVIAVTGAALILILIATVLGEYIAPQSKYLADKRKDSAQSFGQAVATTTGVWIHEGNNFLHIDKVYGLEHLEGVTRYEFNNTHQLIAAYHAKRIVYQQGKWQLSDEVKTMFGRDRTVSQSAKTGTWNLTLNPNLLNVGVISPEQMSLPNLIRYSRHLVENKSQASNFLFEFWKRLFQPLMTLIMILLAVPFVFGSPRSVTMGWRIVLGVIIGFIFYMLNALLGQLSVVFQISPMMSALLPVLLFAVVGYVLLLRIQ
jgi:lipopolysaccharide export system permease protein